MGSGIAYLVVLSFCFGMAGGIIGRIKGNQFVIWFLICSCTWVIGLVAAMLYRWEKNEPRRQCPGCGHILLVTDAVCTTCGEDLDFPEQIIPSELAARDRAA